MLSPVVGASCTHCFDDTVSLPWPGITHPDRLLSPARPEAGVQWATIGVRSFGAERGEGAQGQMDDVAAMRRCIELGREALERGDHPFGSVLVRDGSIFAEGQNRVNTKLDPTAHAESEAIREACKALETLNLSGFAIYASGEPCWMCATVIRQVRISRVVIGARSRGATGGYSSRFPILTEDDLAPLGPPPEVTVGVLADQCDMLLDDGGWSSERRSR